MSNRRVILQQRLGLGDVVVLTAVARELRRHGIEVGVKTHFSPVWAGHRDIAISPDWPDAAIVTDMIREGIATARQGVRQHVLTWCCFAAGRQLGLDLMPRLPKPWIETTPEEDEPPLSGDYWVVVAGGKFDTTTKLWSPAAWQSTVDGLRDRGFAVAQAGAMHRLHWHPRLSGVIDYVSKDPSPRQFFRLIKHSCGVICGVTAAMHIAAAFDKPCVVLAGGREEPWWEEYSDTWAAFGNEAGPVRVPHRFLHTIGKYDCCLNLGCWRHRTTPLKNLDQYDSLLCHKPVDVGTTVFKADHLETTAVPQCLNDITPATVLAEVDTYAKREAAVPFPPQRRISVCVLCYGEHTELAVRCLSSILTAARGFDLDLHVGLNAVCDRTRNYVKAIPGAKIYDHPENAKKYPVMRAMFENITEDVVFWFDDDAQVINTRLFDIAMSRVAEEPEVAAWGRPFRYDPATAANVSADPLAWFKAADWWRDYIPDPTRPTSIEFLVGWFWFARSSAIRAAGVPDARLNHNGGDITIGAQLQQAGFKFGSFNADKMDVWCPSRTEGGRRGYSEKFPWQTCDSL
jgi:GT2 family glycosyltransferase